MDLPHEKITTIEIYRPVSQPSTLDEATGFLKSRWDNPVDFVRDTSGTKFSPIRNQDINIANGLESMREGIEYSLDWLSFAKNMQDWNYTTGKGNPVRKLIASLSVTTGEETRIEIITPRDYRVVINPEHRQSTMDLVKEAALLSLSFEYLANAINQKGPIDWEGIALDEFVEPDSLSWEGATEKAKLLALLDSFKVDKSGGGYLTPSLILS